MAVNIDKPEQNSTTNNQQQHSQYSAQAQAQPQQTVGMGNINSILRRSGSIDRTESRSAEALRALREAAKEGVETQGLANDFELLRFDRDENRVGLPSILVVKKAQTKLGLVYAVRVLLLETEGQRLRPRNINLGMQRFEVPTRAQDVYTDSYWSRVVEFISRSKGITVDPRANGTHIIDAGPRLVPSSMQFAVGGSNQVLRLLVDSINRCDDILGRTSGELPFSIVDVKRSDERLTAAVDFSGSDTTAPSRQTVVGVPYRSDIVITMNRKQVTSGKGDDEFFDPESSFNSVSGFINLEYSPVAPQSQMQTGWGSAPQPTQLFTPTFVITDVSQADWVRAQTPELYLLALSNAYRVTAANQWIRSLLPSVGTKDIDIRDVGALGYLTQAGKKLDTKSSNFTDDSFVELMTMLVRPNPTFLIDIDPLGDHSAIENFLIDAAFPGVNQERAVDYLIKAANNLTGGVFGQLFDKANPIVIPYGQEIHLGYYFDKTGEKRDIRDLDVLAMLNLTEGNLQDFSEWYQTFTNVNEPNELRLVRREKFERNYTSKNMVITGRATRLLFNPAFIECFDEAIRRAGLQVDFENITTIMGAQRLTGNQMVNQYAVSRSAAFGIGGNAGGNVGGINHSGIGGRGRYWS